MNTWSLARRFFVGQLVLLTALTAVVCAVLFFDARAQNYNQAEQRMLSVAATVADSPDVVEAVRSDNPTALLQPYAERVMRDAAVDFVTVMAPDRTRFTHPDPAQIGLPYIGSVEQALAGRPFTEVFAGTLGPSVRAIVPVRGADGEVVALAAAGVTISNLSVALSARIPAVLGLALAIIAASAVLTGLLSRYLQRVTFGWGPEQLARIFVFYDSVLHSVRDGLLLVDPKGQLVLYNDQAAALLGLPVAEDSRPRPAAGMDLPESLKTLLVSGRRAVDEIHFTRDRVLVVNQETATPGSRTPGAKAYGTRSFGTVTTLRDHTEIEALTGEIQTMKTLTEALRAQTHEHSNRLHTIVSLIELGRGAEALDFATRDLQQSQRLTDEVVAAVDEPFLAALLVGKAAQAHERGIRLELGVEGSWETAGVRSSAIPASELVTIAGNLLDNAFDAAAGSAAKTVRFGLTATPGGLEISVTDSGPGVPADAADSLLTLGVTGKQGADGGAHGIGLALVRQAVYRLGGELRIRNGEGGGATFTVLLPPLEAST